MTGGSYLLPRPHRARPSGRLGRTEGSCDRRTGRNPRLLSLSATSAPGARRTLCVRPCVSAGQLNWMRHETHASSMFTI
jgi:hypothetical protein